MKKLSTEEKTKAYDEVLIAAKQLYNDSNTSKKERDLLEGMFPELAEPEDEKIRKGIIRCVQCNMPDNDFRKKYITWLEKQGEKFIPEDIDKAALQYVDTCAVDGEITHNNITEPYWNNHSMMNAYKAGWLERQGEQKPQGKSALKAAKEEKVDNQNCIKLADKVEPKFKIEKDKWYICIRELYDVYNNRIFTKGNIYHSTKDETLMPDNSNVPYEIKYCPDHYFCLWTIEEAKNGDVLSYRDGQWIFIFEEEGMEPITFRYHSLLSNKGIEFNNYCETTLTECIKPATKEQRDLLFQKMKEAGYEWDAEKKELKKIEQKHTDNIPQDFEKYVKHLLSLSDGEGHSSPAKVKEVSAELFKLAQLGEKTAWKPSKEQIIALRWILNNVPYNKHKEEISGLLDQIKDL